LFIITRYTAAIRRHVLYIPTITLCRLFTSVPHPLPVSVDHPAAPSIDFKVVLATLSNGPHYNCSKNVYSATYNAGWQHFTAKKLSLKYNLKYKVHNCKVFKVTIKLILILKFG